VVADDGVPRGDFEDDGGSPTSGRQTSAADRSAPCARYRPRDFGANGWPIGDYPVDDGRGTCFLDGTEMIGKA